MLQAMKADKDISRYVEVVYKEQAADLLFKMWTGMLQGTGMTLDEVEFSKLLDNIVENMYTNLQLSFDTKEELSEYIVFLSKYEDQQKLLLSLTEKSTQDLLTEDQLAKLFKL